MPFFPLMQSTPRSQSIWTMGYGRYMGKSNLCIDFFFKSYLHVLVNL